MARICLSLTGRSIDEDLRILELYRGRVDLVELRADKLEPTEMLHLRAFPQRAGIPSILTVRRKIDGGGFEDGEGVRLVMIAKGLTHAHSDSSANFAYVDLESDFRVPAIEEASRIFGTKIIRSYHDFEGMPADLDRIWSELSSEEEEIPKLAVKCRDADDLALLFEWSRGLPDRERMIIGMGPYGFPSRVLADRLGSSWAFASPISAGLPVAAPGHIDPSILTDIYRLRSLGRESAVYALAGGPSVLASRSPELHNAAFAASKIDAVYLPFPAREISAFLAAAEAADVRGASITVPLKETILPHLAAVTEEARMVGACNTIIRGPMGWIGHNTDTLGFERALRQFLGRTDFAGMRVTVIGAGGAARAVAAVLARNGAIGLVLNRTLMKARDLARRFGFTWASNDERAHDLLSDHSDLIVNATSVGMEGGEPGDPLDWYEFTGREAVYDLVYKPELPPFLARAKAAGCRSCNGFSMLRYQAAEQFRIWTGMEPPAVYYD